MKVKFLQKYPIFANPLKIIEEQKELEAEMKELREKYPDLDANREVYFHNSYALVIQMCIALVVVGVPLILWDLIW